MTAAWCASRAPGRWSPSMRADEYVAPQWPDGPQHAQMHLDLAAADLEDAVAAARRIGAREAGVQPDPSAWRVMLDPVRATRSA